MLVGVTTVAELGLVVEGDIEADIVDMSDIDSGRVGVTVAVVEAETLEPVAEDGVDDADADDADADDDNTDDADPDPDIAESVPIATGNGENTTVSKSVTLAVPLPMTLWQMALSPG